MSKENQIILLNIVFYNNIIKIIKIYMHTAECDKNAGNKLLVEKFNLEMELKIAIDKINNVETKEQTNGNFAVSDKLKILIKENNFCSILLFLMGRTSFIRGYCSGLLITELTNKIKKKLQYIIEKATKLENELFDYQQKLYKKCEC